MKIYIYSNLILNAIWAEKNVISNVTALFIWSVGCWWLNDISSLEFQSRRSALNASNIFLSKVQKSMQGWQKSILHILSVKFCVWPNNVAESQLKLKYETEYRRFGYKFCPKCNKVLTKTLLPLLSKMCKDRQKSLPSAGHGVSMAHSLHICKITKQN